MNDRQFATNNPRPFPETTNEAKKNAVAAVVTERKQLRVSNMKARLGGLEIPSTSTASSATKNLLYQ
jgi:hypothetical protein